MATCRSLRHSYETHSRSAAFYSPLSILRLLPLKHLNRESSCFVRQTQKSSVCTCDRLCSVIWVWGCVSRLAGTCMCFQGDSMMGRRGALSCASFQQVSNSCSSSQALTFYGHCVMGCTIARLFQGSCCWIPKKKKTQKAPTYFHLMCSASETETQRVYWGLNAPLTAGASQLIRPVNDLSACKG